MSASTAITIPSVENQCAIRRMRRVCPSSRKSAPPTSEKVTALLVAIRPIGWYGSRTSVSWKNSVSIPAFHPNTRSPSVTSPIVSTSSASPRPASDR